MQAAVAKRVAGLTRSFTLRGCQYRGFAVPIEIANDLGRNLLLVVDTGVVYLQCRNLGRREWRSLIGAARQNAAGHPGIGASSIWCTPGKGCSRQLVTVGISQLHLLQHAASA